MRKYKTTVSCQCPEDIKSRYNKLYPNTLSKFLIKCIKLATQDCEFFIKIYRTVEV